MQVRQVSFGEVVANIARLDNGVEVIPMPEVYALLNVDKSVISHHLDEFIAAGATNPCFIGVANKTPRIPVEVLRTYGMAAPTGRPPRMVTKEEFQFLVKKVNTPQAWGIYQALWGMAETHVRAIDNGMPAWAAEFKQDLQDMKDICRGLRDEVDELRATLNLLISDDDAKVIRDLIRRIKDVHKCDGRKVVGMVRATLNVGSIYETPDTRKVINVLRNILGEGLQLVKP
jgi:hypothetical protein